MTIRTKVEFNKDLFLILDLDENTYIAKNFQLKELANVSAKDNIKYILNERQMKFIAMIQEFRNAIKSPMKCNSNYRTVSFNNSLKNADRRSCHLRALAFDWGYTSKRRQSQINEDILRWKNLCTKYHEIGAINLYTNGEHFEIASDEQYGNKTFEVRDYRKTGKDW